MPVPPDEAPWKIGLRGAKANLVPGLALQALAIALVFSYYRLPAARELLDRLSAFRTSTGFLYGIVATALCGGIIPLLYLKCRAATRERFTWAQGSWLALIWAYKGFEVDLWYSGLAAFVGNDNRISTVLTKMMLDQFVYCPLWAVPTMWFGYAWVELHFRLKPVISDLRTPGWYRRRAVPLLVSNLGVWLPAVCVIYSLPTPLQLPLFNLVLCFYTLLVAHISQPHPRPPPQTHV